MTITISAESLNTRTASLTEELTSQKGDLNYILFSDEPTQAAQQTDILAWVQSDGGLISHYGLPPSNFDPQELGNGWYRVRCQFGDNRKRRKNLQPPQVDESSFSFTIQTTQQHIRQSEKLIKKSDNSGPTTGIDSGTGATASGTDPPDAWDIGNSTPIAEESDRIQGADIYVPQATWQEEYTFADGLVTESYKLWAMRTVGKTNNATFKGVPAREALCTGVSGAKQGSNPWTLTFDFLYAEAETVEYRIAGGGTIVMTKEGHDLWDFRYDDEFDSVAGHKVRLPQHVLIHRVYREANFSILGIGT